MLSIRKCKRYRAGSFACPDATRNGRSGTAPEAIVSMPARHNPSDTLQEAEAQEYALLEQQIRSEVGSLAWDIQPVLHLSQELDGNKQQNSWNRPASRISGRDSASPFDSLSELPHAQVRSAPGLRPPSPPSPPLPTPTHSQATTHPSIKNKKHEAAGAPNLRTREADSSPGTLEATLMHIPKDQMSPSAYGEAHQDGCFEFRVASSCHAASCSPTPCLPDASPRSISEPHPSPVFASHPASISPVEPRLELPLDPGKSRGASVSPQQLQLEEQVRKVQYQSQQQEHQQQQIAAAFAELHRAQHALHQERLAFEAHKENAHAQMRAAHSRQQESLQKQKAQLDEQRGALAQLPTRKERAEVEAAAALVEQLRKDSKAKDSRHKLSVERMRRQVLVLQDANLQLKNENQATKKELEKLRADTSKKSKKKAKNQRSISCQTTADSDLQQAPSPHGTTASATGTPEPGEGRLNATCSGTSDKEADGAAHTAVSMSQQSENSTHRANPTGFQRTSTQQVDTQSQQPSLRKQSPAGYVPPESHPSQSQPNPNHSLVSISTSDLRVPEASAACSRDTDIHAITGHEDVRQSSDQLIAQLRERSRPRITEEHCSAQPQAPHMHKGDSSVAPTVDRSSPDFDIRFHEPACERSNRESSMTSYWESQPAHDLHAHVLQNDPKFTRSDSLERLQAVADCQERIRMNSKPSKNVKFSLESLWGLPAEHQGHDRHLPEHTNAAPYSSAPQGVSVRSAQQGQRSPTPGSLHTSKQLAIRSSHASTTWAPTWPRTSTSATHSNHDLEVLSHRTTSKPTTPDISGRHNTNTTACTGAGNARPDGSSPVSLKDGSRGVVKMVDDTQVVTMGDGTVSVLFCNGDIKQTKRCGTVEYFYKEMSTWHTTLPSGVEVFYFPNGQTEAHHADGSKEMLFSDGSIRMILPNGCEVPHHAAALSEAVLAPKPIKPSAFCSNSNSPAQ